MNASTRHEVVSRDDEELILVNAEDEPLGTLAKSACHDGDGVLHRAFSLFVFNDAGETLLQRRHASKRLWPGYWANSCCSHPRAGESMAAAVRRRALDELGIDVAPEFLFKFQYQAAFADCGAEFELCSVFRAKVSGEPCINTAEIADWRWVAPEDVDRQLRESPHLFTPWLKLEWRRVREELSAFALAESRRPASGRPSAAS